MHFEFGIKKMLDHLSRVTFESSWSIQKKEGRKELLTYSISAHFLFLQKRSKPQWNFSLLHSSSGVGSPKNLLLEVFTHWHLSLSLYWWMFPQKANVCMMDMGNMYHDTIFCVKPILCFRVIFEKRRYILYISLCIGQIFCWRSTNVQKYDKSNWFPRKNVKKWIGLDFIQQPTVASKIDTSSIKSL